MNTPVELSKQHVTAVITTAVYEGKMRPIRNPAARTPAHTNVEHKSKTVTQRKLRPTRATEGHQRVSKHQTVLVPKHNAGDCEAAARHDVGHNRSLGIQQGSKHDA